LRSIVCAWVVWYSGFAFVDPASWFVLALFVVPVVTKTLDASTVPSGAPTGTVRGRTGRTVEPRVVGS
jgi:hypothetical protein